MAIPAQPTNPQQSEFDRAPARKSDPFNEFITITSQSGNTSIKDQNGYIRVTRGITSIAGGTVHIQGSRDSAQTLVQLNAGVEYSYAIAAFTFGTATDLAALF